MLLRSAEEIGTLIRAERRRLGLGQGALAERAGVSRLWLSEVERGKPRAEIGLILRALSALHIDLTAEPPSTTRFTDSTAEPLLSARFTDSSAEPPSTARTAESTPQLPSTTRTAESIVERPSNTSPSELPASPPNVEGTSVSNAVGPLGDAHSDVDKKTLLRERMHQQGEDAIVGVDRRAGAATSSSTTSAPATSLLPRSSVAVNDPDTTLAQHDDLLR